jgi:hypothetical protein
MATITEASSQAGIGAGQAQVFNTNPSVQNFNAWATNYYNQKQKEAEEQRKLEQEKENKAQEDLETILTYTPEAYLPYQDEATKKANAVMTETQQRIAKGEKFTVGSPFYYEMKKKMNEAKGFVAKTKDVEAVVKEVRNEVLAMDKEQYNTQGILAELNNFIGKNLNEVTTDDIKNLRILATKPEYVNIDGMAKAFVEQLGSITDESTVIKQEGAKTWSETVKSTIPPYIERTTVTRTGMDGKIVTTVVPALENGKVKFTQEGAEELIRDLKTTKPQLFEAIQIRAEKQQQAGDQRPFDVILKEVAQNSIKQSLKATVSKSETGLQDQSIAQAQLQIQREEAARRERELKLKEAQAMGAGAGTPESATALTDVGRIISGDESVYTGTNTVNINGTMKTLPEANGAELLGGGKLGKGVDADQIDKIYFDPETNRHYFTSKNDKKPRVFNYTTVRTLIENNTEDAKMKQQLIKEMESGFISEKNQSIKPRTILGTPVTKESLATPERFTSAIANLTSQMATSESELGTADADDKNVFVKKMNEALKPFTNLNVTIDGKTASNVQLKKTEGLTFGQSVWGDYVITGKDEFGKDVILYQGDLPSVTGQMRLATAQNKQMKSVETPATTQDKKYPTTTKQKQTF